LINDNDTPLVMVHVFFCFGQVSVVTCLFFCLSLISGEENVTHGAAPRDGQAARATSQQQQWKRKGMCRIVIHLDSCSETFSCRMLLWRLLSLAQAVCGVCRLNDSSALWRTAPRKVQYDHFLNLSRRSISITISILSTCFVWTDRTKYRFRVLAHGCSGVTTWLHSTSLC